MKKGNLVQLFKINRIWSDPLIRNLCSGSLFAVTFIWAAINFFGVDLEIINTFLLLSFMFVASMILVQTTSAESLDVALNKVASTETHRAQRAVASSAQCPLTRVP